MKVKKSYIIPALVLATTLALTACESEQVSTEAPTTGTDNSVVSEETSDEVKELMKEIEELQARIEKLEKEVDENNKKTAEEETVVTVTKPIVDTTTVSRVDTLEKNVEDAGNKINNLEERQSEIEETVSNENSDERKVMPEKFYITAFGIPHYDHNWEIAPGSVYSGSLIRMITKGDSRQYDYYVFPVDSRKNAGVTWESSDTSVATVDSTGKVYGIKPGETTITAKTVNGLEDAFTLVVNDYRLYIDTECYNIDGSGPYRAGDSIVINAVRPHIVVTDNSESRDFGPYTYSSSNESILSIDTEGNITLKQLGTCTITVRGQEGLEVSQEVEVLASP